MKTFDEMYEENLGKTRHYKFPDHVIEASQRRMWWFEQCSRQSAKEIYEEMKIEIERLEQELKDSELSTLLTGLYK